MPGRDYLRAHALFEETLVESAYPRLQWTTQRNNLAVPLRPSPPLNTAPTASEERTSPNTSRSPPPASSDAQSDIDPSFGLAQALQLSDRSSSTRPSTPFGLASSITPDTQITPPSLGSRADSKALNAVVYRSSHGESFKTAQEDLASLSSADSPPCLPMHGTDGLDCSPRGLSFSAGHDRRPSANLVNPSSRQDEGNPILSSLVIESQDCALAPPVVLRHRRRKTMPRPNDLTFLDDRRESDDTQWPCEQSPYSWYDASDKDEDVETPKTPEANPPGYVKEADYVHMTPPKRLPSNPKPSAIIEADIQDSPDATPRTERRLRHVHKTDALRGSPGQGPTTGGEVGKELFALPAESDRTRNEDIREKTRSSLAASLVIDFAAPPSWQRPKSLVMTSIPGLEVRGTHPQRLSASFAERLGPSQRLAAQSLDRPHDLARGELSDRAPYPLDFQQLDSWRDSPIPIRSSEGHLNLDMENQASNAPPRGVSARPSLFSEASEGLVVGDAQAISIFPHNNHSLLLVHQQRSAPQSKENSPVAKSSTPGIRNTDLTEATHSPLTKPRPATDLPEISASSNLPEEAAFEPKEHVHAVGVRPQLSRHESLMRRAIRTFSGPNGLLTGRQTRRSIANASEDRWTRGATPTSVHKNAHSFWHPRAFWDGFNDAGDVNVDHNATEPASHRLEHSNSLRRTLGRQPLRRSARTQANSYPSSMPEECSTAATADDETIPAISRTALQRLASLKASLQQIGATGAGNRSRSQRRRLAVGLKEKIQERTNRREQRLRQQERDRIRDSIGPRYYVDNLGLHD